MAVTRNKLSPDLPGRVAQFVAARLAHDELLSVGLSGGCDSVVLLHLLRQCPLAADRLIAVHVHHGLSENGAAWARFCTDYCADLDVPLRLIRVRVAAASGSGPEAAARQARYTAFNDLVPGTALLLAQHRGDQAETVFLNFLRGSGLTGMAGMPAERHRGRLRLLRPLLGFSRRQIEDYGLAHGLRWVDDESNCDPALTRNYLRHHILPSLKPRFPGLENVLAHEAMLFGEAQELLDELAAADWQRVASGEDARLRALRQLSLVRLKNLLRYRLRCLGWQVPVARRLDEFARQLLTAAPDRHPELMLPAGVMRAGRGRLHWLANE